MMTSAQRALYRAALQIGRSFGTGGGTWGGQRSTGGTPATAATINTLADATGYFLTTALMKELISLPSVALYSAPYWWITGADTDTQADDIRTNGSIAFLILGVADVSQGFAIVPAALTSIPDDLSHTLLDSGGQPLLDDTA